MKFFIFYLLSVLSINCCEFFAVAAAASCHGPLTAGPFAVAVAGGFFIVVICCRCCYLHMAILNFTTPPPQKLHLIKKK
jgi:hypothetical protein